jgi:hypothetical protein
MNKHVAEKADSFSSPEKAKDYFLRLLNYINDTVRVVEFVLPTDEAAYTIFETLNDRGLELAPLDLVKNYLFSKAEKFRPGSLPEFEERWSAMMTVLSSARADAFLRAFWSTRFGKPEGARLFARFKRAYSEADDLYDVSVAMRSEAEKYAALFNSNDPIWHDYPYNAKRSIDALGIIGFSQSYPIILAALGRFNIREMERLLWLIECLAVRWQLIGGQRPGRVESLGARAAREITEGKIDTASGVFALVDELYLPDKEFTLKFETAVAGSARKARYLLAGLEREALKRDNTVLSDELAPAAVTLEHIFPQRAKEGWGGVPEKMVARLGNLCLLPGVNNALGNKPWADKVAIYAKSQMKTTRALTRYGKWEEKEIEERQKHMAELARSAWSFQ